MSKHEHCFLKSSRVWPNDRTMTFMSRKWRSNLWCVSWIEVFVWRITVLRLLLSMDLDLLFDNASDDSMTPSIFRILVHIIHQSQHQTAHNLLLAHTLLCFYFQRLSASDRQLYAYCLLRVRWDAREKSDSILSRLVITTNITRTRSWSDASRATHTSATFRLIVIVKWWYAQQRFDET